jgi:molybdopterin molybdotransferase
VGEQRLVIAFSQALERILEACTPLGSERVALAAAAGRIAAATVAAREDLVPFARSAMDGFAVRVADLAAAPVELAVRARSFPGDGAVDHAPGTASAVATGAPVPRGADAVLPIEDVETSDGVVRIGRVVAAGAYIFGSGEDARAGDTIVERGTLLRPSALGLLAAAGHATVEVYRKPRLAIVCTGDELVPVEATPGYGQIRNSNATTIAAAAQAAGVSVVATSEVGDDRRLLREALAAAMECADLVVTTGGASAGERDFVKPLLDELGVTFAFRTLALRPAKPSAFGRLGAVRIGVLPGNPSSAFVALHLLLRPAFDALSGRAGARPRLHPARLDGRVRAKAQATFASYARIRLDGGRLTAQPLDNQCSSLTRSARDADGFILLPPGERTLEAGATVDVAIFDWTNVGEAS